MITLRLVRDDSAALFRTDCVCIPPVYDGAVILPAGDLLLAGSESTFLACISSVAGTLLCTGAGVVFAFLRCNVRLPDSAFVSLLLDTIAARLTRYDAGIPVYRVAVALRLADYVTISLVRVRDGVVVVTGGSFIAPSNSIDAAGTRVHRTYALLLIGRRVLRNCVQRTAKGQDVLLPPVVRSERGVVDRLDTG